MTHRLAGLLVFLALAGCASLLPSGPERWGLVVSDPEVEARATALMQTILAVTPHAYLADRYQVRLARLRERGWGGLSGGGGVIYLDHDVARAGTAVPPRGHETLLAMVLAHEIAHEIAGHAAVARMRTRVHAWTPAHQARHELEADALAIGYWQALGWPCSLWVVRFQAEVRFGGDRPRARVSAADRLAQAMALCGRSGPEALTVPTSGILAR
jgi:hypothetical protein